MDPDTTLDELLELTDPLLDPNHAVPLCPTDAARIAELVHELDQWLMTGGFLPRRWAPAVRRR